MAAGVFILASYAVVVAAVGPWGLLAALAHAAACAAAVAGKPRK